MPAWVEEGPFALVVGFLLVVVFVRAQATYWLGRSVAEGARRTRWSALFTGPRVGRATASIHRWGWPIIPVSFLTVGFQSAVNGAAGVIRMPWPRYTLAMLPGCVIWAVVYAFGGLAAFRGAAALAARSPWALAAVLVALACLIAGIGLWRHRRREARASVEALTEASRRGA